MATNKNTPERVKQIREWIVKNDASFNDASKQFGLSPTTLMYAANESKAAIELGPWEKCKTIPTRAAKRQVSFVDIKPAKQTSNVAIVICSSELVKDLLASLT